MGGGGVGVSALYHLTRKGWTDVALIERTELTGGSTWHAAGLLPLFNMSYTVGQLHKYSVDLYKRLPAETGQDVSFHVTGDRKSTRLNSSHSQISYAVFCLKKKKQSDSNKVTHPYSHTHDISLHSM